MRNKKSTVKARGERGTRLVDRALSTVGREEGRGRRRQHWREKKK